MKSKTIRKFFYTMAGGLVYTYITFFITFEVWMPMWVMVPTLVLLFSTLVVVWGEMLDVMLSIKELD